MNKRYLQLEIDRNYTADLDFKGEILEIVVKTTEGEFIVNKSDIQEKPKPIYISDDDMDDICKSLSEIFGEDKPKEKPKKVDINEIFKDDSFWD